jgi:glycine dehydrogenase subunit 2
MEKRSDQKTNRQPPIPKPHGPPKRAGLNEPLIAERGSAGRIGYSLPIDDIPDRDLAQDLPSELCRETLQDFPEVSEGEVVRHFTRLSQWNFSAGCIPLARAR